MKYGSKFYYVKSGKVQTNYTGLVSHNSNWYYVKKGVKATNYTGWTKYKGIWFYVRKGNATVDEGHYCVYTDATCTTPKTCIYCFDTRGSATDHSFVNSNCSKCNKYIEIPFTVNTKGTLYYFDTAFTIDSYTIRDIDEFDQGFAKLYFSVTNITGGYCYFHINFYDKYGYIINNGTYSGSKNAGQEETDYTYIPEGTARIEFTRCD